MVSLELDNIDLLVLLDLVEDEIDFRNGEDRTDESFVEYLDRLERIRKVLLSM